jgi:hypothetical protein
MAKAGAVTVKSLWTPSAKGLSRVALYVHLARLRGPQAGQNQLPQPMAKRPFSDQAKPIWQRGRELIE